MIQKAIAIALLTLVSCVVPTINAQSSSIITPTIGGGYHVTNSNGSSSIITPTIGGGYHVTNSGGGYNVLNYGGGGGNGGQVYNGGQYWHDALSGAGENIGNAIAQYIQARRQAEQIDQMFQALSKMTNPATHKPYIDQRTLDGLRGLTGMRKARAETAILGAMQLANQLTGATKATPTVAHYQQRRTEATKRYNAASFAKHSAASHHHE